MQHDAMRTVAPSERVADTMTPDRTDRDGDTSKNNTYRNTWNKWKAWSEADAVDLLMPTETLRTNNECVCVLVVYIYTYIHSHIKKLARRAFKTEDICWTWSQNDFNCHASSSKHMQIAKLVVVPWVCVIV